jgi:hypothetical protein
LPERLGLDAPRRQRGDDSDPTGAPLGRKKIPNAESAQVVRTPFQRTGEGERRLRGAAQEPISGFDSRLRGAVAASVCLTALLAAPPATALRPTDLGRAVTPLAFSVDLGYGARGRAGASLQRRLVDLGYLRRGAVDGVFGDETRNAVVAFQGWERIGRDGVVGPRTRGALRRAWAPQPWLPRRRALEIDLRRQVLLVVEGGVVRRAIHVSSGAFSPTPEGRFTIVRRMRESWSRPFHVWLPYALYFHRGLAIHGFPIVPTDRRVTARSGSSRRCPVRVSSDSVRDVLIRGARRPPRN